MSLHQLGSIIEVVELLIELGRDVLHRLDDHLWEGLGHLLDDVDELLDLGVLLFDHLLRFFELLLELLDGRIFGGFDLFLHLLTGEESLFKFLGRGLGSLLLSGLLVLFRLLSLLSGIGCILFGCLGLLRFKRGLEVLLDLLDGILDLLGFLLSRSRLGLHGIFKLKDLSHGPLQHRMLLHLFFLALVRINCIVDFFVNL